MLTIAQSDAPGTENSPKPPPLAPRENTAERRGANSRATAGSGSEGGDPTKLEAALEAARRGFSVFPIDPGAKKPAIKRWQELATADPVQLGAWWTQWPDANIGISTARFLVVDIDPKKGGDASAKRLHKDEDGGLPKTLCSKTWSGGAHMIYALPDHVFVSNSVGSIAPGIDIRSWGGLIVAPGSTIDGKPYQWLNNRRPVLAPQWLINKCKAARAKNANAGKRVAPETQAAIDLAFHYLASRSVPVEDGNRDNAAFKMAAALFDFGVSRETCLDLMLEWDSAMCHPPLGADTISVKVDSAQRNRQNTIGSRSPEPLGMDAVEIAPRVEKTPEPVAKGISKKEYHEIYEHLLRRSRLLEGSDRETAALSLATALVTKCSPNQTIELMRVWNEAACEPDLDDVTLQSTIDEATRNCPRSIPAASTEAGAGTPHIPFKEPWGDPVDLWPTPLAPAELPSDAVPDIVARFAHDRGQRLGIAPGAAAAALVTALSSLVPAGNELQMRQRDPHWTVRPILWTAIIGDPGSNKSAALAAAVAPIKAIEDKWRLQYAAEARRVEIAKTAATSKRERGSTESAEPLGVASSRPVYRQKIVNDATTEALAPLLAENVSGLLCYVDELAGLFGGMDAYRQKGGKDRPFWLQAKDGGALTINRKTSDRIVVKNCAISILGSIQPEKIRKLSPGLSEDGFLQRFSLVHIRRHGNTQDLAPDTELDSTLARVASSLVESADFARFRFAPDADAELQEIEAYKNREIARPNASNFIRQWLDKLPNEFGRVALAFHHIEHCTSDAAAVFEDPAPDLICLDTARRARRYLTEFIYSHVQAFSQQAPQASAGADHADWVAGFILAGERGKIDARDIYRSYHAIEREEIPRVMADLELLDWVRPIKFSHRNVATGWAVNPAVHDGRFAAIAEAERIRRADVREKASQGRSREVNPASATGQV